MCICEKEYWYQHTFPSLWPLAPYDDVQLGFEKLNKENISIFIISVYKENISFFGHIVLGNQIIIVMRFSTIIVYEERQ